MTNREASTQYCAARTGGRVGLADRAAADRMAWAGRTVAECCSSMRARCCFASSSSSLEEDLDSRSAVEV